jgi:hypothetical protein
VRREGWIAFLGTEVWGVPTPLRGKAFQIGRSSTLVASQNERAIWMDGDAFLGDDSRWPREPRTYVEYDGVERDVIDRATFPAGARFVADTPAGLIVCEMTGSWSLWQRGARAGEPLDLSQAGPPGTFWPNAGADEVTFFDDMGGPVQLAHPLPGTPRSRSVSFSPDRRYAAVDVDISEDLPPPSMIDIARGRVKYTPKPHRLALIECTTGKVAIADGEFDNFAYPPVGRTTARG